MIALADAGIVLYLFGLSLLLGWALHRIARMTPLRRLAPGLGQLDLRPPFSHGASPVDDPRRLSGAGGARRDLNRQRVEWSKPVVHHFAINLRHSGNWRGTGLRR